jgi:glycerol-3-phosphate dehydrogenase (NAD(P)+)
MSQSETYDIGVIGAGAWGTTLAMHLSRKGQSVLLWAFEPEVADSINQDHRNPIYLPDFELPVEVKSTGDLAQMGAISRLLIVVPSAFYASTVKQLASHVSGNAKLLSATKGFLDSNLRRPSEMLKEIFPGHQTGVLSGPNLSKEIAAGLPAVSRVASESEEFVREFQQILSSERFRVYGGSDIVGTELGGSLKNIIALAAGMASGLHLGENALAALITRGLAEIIKLGELLSAEARTFYGVSGLGDLICTCQSSLSRNYQVGYRLANSETLSQILSSISAVPEGVDTTRHVYQYAQNHGLDLPITGAVYNILFEESEPAAALRDLMTRTLKME